MIIDRKLDDQHPNLNSLCRKQVDSFTFLPSRPEKGLQLPKKGLNGFDKNFCLYWINRGDVYIDCVRNYSQPWNNQTRAGVQGYMADRLWLADGVWHKMCDSLTDSVTELEMAVNAWVAFATNKRTPPRFLFQILYCVRIFNKLSNLVLSW